MAKLQIVIEIPEEVYKYAKGYNASSMLALREMSMCMNAIANGTPLPKGHGELKDADDIALIDEQFYVPSDYYVAESAINDAPTIIEADKESDTDVPQ